ncbi:MAG TPA: FGGY family carbohydrate kinase, partial [Ktedonobacterales bacterium]
MAVQEPVYVGLDVGTSSLKAIAITSAGRAVAVEQADYPLLRPRPGWIEQHPDMWWEAACAALQRLLRRRTVADSRIAAVGVTGQMHGVTLLDAAGQVVRPSLIWPDNRGIVELAEFTLRIPAKDLLSISGSLPYASATLAKLLWLRAREPDTMARAAHILLAKDFLRLRLTDDYATDPTDASGTMLFNIRERRWSARV